MTRFARSGKEHGALLDDTGNILKYFDGVTNSIYFSSRDINMIRVHGNKFLHNHPQGGSFSMNDLGFSIGNNLAEIQALSPKDKYVFKLLKADKLTAEKRDYYADKAFKFHRKNTFFAREKRDDKMETWITDHLNKKVVLSENQIQEQARLMWVEETHKAMQKTSQMLNDIGLKNTYTRTTGGK